MKKILATLLLLVSFNSYSQTVEWSTTDKTLLAAAATLQVIDWGQTRTIAKDDRYYERNPFMSRHPSLGEVNKHFALGLVMIPLIAHYFPEARTTLLSSWLALEVVCVGNNYHLGVRLSY